MQNIYFCSVLNEKSYSWRGLSDDALVKLIGDFVKYQRLSQNRSQNDLGDAAGISRSTLSLLERGEVVSLSTVIKVLRVLDQLSVLESFTIPDEPVSPIQLAKLEKKKRKRAGKSKKKKKRDQSDW